MKYQESEKEIRTKKWCSPMKKGGKEKDSAKETQRNNSEGGEKPERVEFLGGKEDSISRKRSIVLMATMMKTKKLTTILNNLEIAVTRNSRLLHGMMEMNLTGNEFKR